MKPISVVLSFAVLFTGCYSHTTVATDTPNLDNEELIFELADESYIYSESGQHQRLENGYRIVGDLRRTPKDNWNTLNYQRPDSLFDGIVLDENIKEVVAVELDVRKTVVASSLGGLFLVGLIMLLSNPPSLSISLNK